MAKVKYYQIAFKGVGIDQQCQKLTSLSRTKIEALKANNWTVKGYTNKPVFVNPILDGTTVREKTATEIEDKKLSGMISFSKRQIRQACQAIDKADPAANMEARLDAIIDANAKSWNEATIIELNDPETQLALTGAGIDIKLIKQEMFKL